MRKYLFFFMTFFCFHLSANEQWNQIFEKGMHNLNQENYAEAYDCFSQCVNTKNEKDFFYYDSLTNRISCLFHLGFKDKANKECDLVLKECPYDLIKYQIAILKFSNVYPSSGNELLEKSSLIDEFYRKTHHKNLGEETVIGYIPDPVIFSFQNLCCFLIHNRMVYSSEDIERLDYNHYRYKKSCFCGCEKSKQKFRTECDVCGKELMEMVETDDDDSSIHRFQELFSEEPDMVDNKWKESTVFLASIMTPEVSVSQSACDTACSLAFTAAEGLCVRKFTTNWRRISCIEFAKHLTDRCYDCCKSKNNFVQCTAPFSTMLHKLNQMWEEAGNGLAIDWMCSKCGYFNQNSWPPFVCRNCWRLKNLP